MRTFDHFPKGSECLICGTDEDKECCLIPVNGTQEGLNYRAEPTHTKCLESVMDNLFYDSTSHVLFIMLEVSDG